jgi:hypothetical protein
LRPGTCRTCTASSRRPRAGWGIATPAGFDAFVREVGEPAPEDALPPEGREHDPARIGEIGARYEIELLGPPGTLP